MHKNPELIASRGLLRNDLNYISEAWAWAVAGAMWHASPDADGVRQIEREMHWVNS